MRERERENRQTETDRQTYRQSDKQMVRHADPQTDTEQTPKQTDRHIETRQIKLIVIGQAQYKATEAETAQKTSTDQPTNRTTTFTNDVAVGRVACTQ